MLAVLAEAIEVHSALLLAENERDSQEHESSLEPALTQRLKLSVDKIDTLVQGIRELAKQPDPLGAILTRTQLDEGLILEKISVPLGVVAVIFESRPDVFFQVLGLALRSGNGVVLKGGREATHSNRAMLQIAREAFMREDLPAEWFTLIEGREAVNELLQFDDLIDLVIPRGSNEFVRFIQEHSRIPVLGHASGVCHLYVHPSAQAERALEIIVDAKTQYPAACNSVETVLIDEMIAPTFVPRLMTTLQAAGVYVRGCSRCEELLDVIDRVADDQWETEYGSLVIALKVVPSLEAAIAHINRHGSHHTDGILAEDQSVCETFIEAVDSASVFANCSTRFADGYRYALGAEIGIGTGKLHARGPVGMEGLLTYKYVLRGNGQIVRTYSGRDGKALQFKRLS
jgi:glutamate-5-semialdehyde dehydrogenase